jgi:hypothetical protein
VIALAFLVARLVIGSDVAAGFAALSFALTPKAHPIAVLWISARGDLLMALFSLAATAAWIVWTRAGRWPWLAWAAVAYVLALSSKETATLLPLLLLLTPRSERTWTARAAGCAMLAGLAVIFYIWRAHVGALTPFSGDEHYNLMVPLAQWMRSTTNYAGRMIVAPLSLIALLGLARLADRRPSAPPGLHSSLILVDVIVFAAAFVVVFLAPVLPIVLRSELYLYLPVFGVCVFTGWLAALLFQRVDPRLLTGAIAIYTLVFAGYQMSRALEIHRDLVFSRQLVESLRSYAPLTAREGHVLLVPGDQATEHFLQRAVGGYLYLAMRFARPDTRLTAGVEYPGDRPAPAGLRLACLYRQDDGALIMSPAP